MAIVPENLDVNISKLDDLLNNTGLIFETSKKMAIKYGWEIAAHGLNHFREDVGKYNVV